MNGKEIFMIVLGLMLWALVITWYVLNRKADKAYDTEQDFNRLMNKYAWFNIALGTFGILLIEV